MKKERRAGHAITRGSWWLCAVAALATVHFTAHRAAAETRTVPDPYRTIQSAIDAAVDGDVVLVAPGVYAESINLAGKAILVQGAEGPEATIIDASGIGKSVVHFVNFEQRDTVLEGFTLRGGEAAQGAGIFVAFSDPIVRRCIITQNNAATEGGGAFTQVATPLFLSCVFVENEAGVFGGGMYNLGADVEVVNCVFTGNVAGGGGGMNNLLAEPVVVNCTFVGNEASFGGGLRSSSNGSPAETVARNSIFWGNIADSGPDLLALAGATIVAMHSIVDGGWDGEGNLDADPVFTGGDPYPLRLAPGSPGIDAGSNSAVPDGVETDQAGDPRFADDPDSRDSGEGSAPFVDIGAYERLLGLACTGDVDGNGMVDFTDLLEVISRWGPCPGCAADLDGSGEVGLTDLLAVLSGWGPC